MPSTEFVISYYLVLLLVDYNFGDFKTVRKLLVYILIGLRKCLFMIPLLFGDLEDSISIVPSTG